VKFESKKSLIQGYAVIDLPNLVLNEIYMCWKFLNNYPLVSINEKSTITDTMIISSNTFYQNSKFNNQLLRFDFVYNNEKMKTRSIASFIDSTTYSIPINFIEYNNDYLNILSRPNQSLYFTNKFLTTIGSIKLDSIFDIGLQDKSLLNAISLSQDMLTDLTGISYYSEDWRLNWTSIKKKFPVNN